MRNVFFAEIVDDGHIVIRTTPLTNSLENAKQLVVRECHEGLVNVQLARNGNYRIYELNFIDDERIYTCNKEDLVVANVPKSAEEGKIVDLL